MANMPFCPNRGRWRLCFIYSCLVYLCHVTSGHERFDEHVSPNIFSLLPRGVRVSVKGHPSFTGVCFHANINEPIEKWKYGDIDLDLEYDGKEWVGESSHVVLDDGDIIYYWMHIKSGETGDLLEGRSFIPLLPNRENSGGTRIAVRQNAPIPVKIDPDAALSASEDDRASDRASTPFEKAVYTFLPHRHQNDRLHKTPSKKPQPIYNSQILLKPTTEYIESSQTSFINPSQTGFTDPAQSEFINPSQTGFNSPSQNGFNGQTSIPVTNPLETFKPPTPVYIPQDPILSDKPVPNYPIQNQPERVYPNCEESKTTVNGRHVCKEQQIFLDTFNYYNSTVWSYDMEFPSLPDSEFCVFTGLNDNSRTSEGSLKIWPTLTDDKYGSGFVNSGRLDLPDCTSSKEELCSQEGEFAYILPPTMSARYSTRGKWSFKFGRVDIVAKVARGDWLYPEFWLVPEEWNIQQDFVRRLEMAVVRGNTHLKNKRGEEIGAQLLEAGASVPNEPKDNYMRKKFKLENPDDGLWTDDFHTFSLLWTRDAIAFSVDNIEIGVVGSRGEVNSFMFHNEMSLVIGLGVGGVRVFPDTHEKPWTNTEPKAMYKFWGAKDKWHKTWSRDSKTMIIKEIKVTSL